MDTKWQRQEGPFAPTVGGMTNTNECPTCDLLAYLGELFTWDAEGAFMWEGWDADNEDPPGSDDHFARRPARSDYRLEADLLDSAEFVRAAQMLTCASHPGKPLHIPGKLDDGTVGPACGAAPHGAIVSGQIYALSMDPLVHQAEDSGLVRAMHAMHPGVTCTFCGDALTDWHLAKSLQLESTQRWRTWLRGGRREPLAEGCHVSIAINGPGISAFR